VGCSSLLGLRKGICGYFKVSLEIGHHGNGGQLNFHIEMHVIVVQQTIIGEALQVSAKYKRFMECILTITRQMGNDRVTAVDDRHSAVVRLHRVWYHIFVMRAQVAYVFKLERSEKLQLVEDLWDSIAADPASIPVTDWQKAELRRRKQKYLKNPKLGSSWTDVKRRIRARHGR
jgi:putative addiction module component (TIGR02574 family)